MINDFYFKTYNITINNMLNENIYRFVSIVELKIKYYYITDVSFGRIVIAKKKKE